MSEYYIFNRKPIIRKVGFLFVNKPKINILKLHDTILLLKLFIMSIQLYTADNINIVAGKSEILPTTMEGTESGEKNYTIRLHISILVNGKIKTIFQQYEVDLKKKKLVDYSALNALSDILSDLGYRITGIYSIVEKGIDKLF